MPLILALTMGLAACDEKCGKEPVCGTNGVIYVNDCDFEENAPKGVTKDPIEVCCNNPKNKGQFGCKGTDAAVDAGKEAGVDKGAMEAGADKGTIEAGTDAKPSDAKASDAKASQ